ncbi:5-formyltetrahydrofolate cyclo-ligase [Brachybacterium sp. AOP43-C2-M15]|uniref:5-formyltetrahydrofolate cyclo-ligase n=1 Tax=Brachybacterium sp. AOP43-C2-M15 TaxID=3457661 RepID=UPI004033761A
MDQETTASRKKELRRRLRTRRAELHGGTGAARREREAAQILEHAAPLVRAVEQAISASAARGAGLARPPEASLSPGADRPTGRERAPGGDGSQPAAGTARTVPMPLVAAYHPTPTEADVLPLARRLSRAGARLVFPAAAGRELEWITWDGSSAFHDSPGRGFGEEPDGERLGPHALAEAVLVLAPALAVDRSGTRLGHGAGYYDRALTSVPAGTPVVAVVHPEELLEAGALPRAAHDVPIPTVLTADGLVSLVTSGRS